MPKNYKKLTIQITEEERASFKKKVRSGVSKAMDLRRANDLLNSIKRKTREIMFIKEC